MQVEFRTSRLERCYREHRRAVKAWGADIAERYIERINILKFSRSVEDLYRIETLRFHELKGQRAGEYAIWLGRRERLIVTFRDDAMTVVRIEEVTVDHHGN